MDAKNNRFYREPVEGLTDADLKRVHDAMWNYMIEPAGNPDMDYDGPWFVIDKSTAEPDVNWPGELISEHKTKEEAQIGLARAVLSVLPALKETIDK